MLLEGHQNVWIKDNILRKIINIQRKINMYYRKKFNLGFIKK
jgi:hypothetical protein